MDEFTNNSTNNIFDTNNIYFNNQTYTNGFNKYFNHIKNYNTFYIKKRVNNNLIRQRNNSSKIEQTETITQNIFHPSETSKDLLGIETIPIFNLKLNQSKDNLDNIHLEKQKIYINKKKVKNLLNKSKKKSVNKNITNFSIDEINISLKKLKIKGSKSNNNSLKKNKKSNSRNEQINNKILKTKNNLDSRIDTETETNSILKISKTKKDNLNKINKNFNKLIIKNESEFSYINNSGNNNKIIFLKKIIYQQNNNIKSLREQNKNLIEKIKKMHQENKYILDFINSLKSDILLSSKNNNNKNGSSNLIGDNYIKSKNCIINKCPTEPSEINNLNKIREKFLNSKTLIYSLYDNKNLLSYDFENNEFKLIPINNDQFQNNFIKDINKLSSFCPKKNILYIIAGINNDQLFIFDIKTKKIKKNSNLKNNHMSGGLLFLNNNDSEKEALICLSGKFNKKVEIYNDDNDLWNDKIIEEMPEERCNSCYLLLNNNFIYGFYGYNYILNKYLNDIIYYDLNNNKWNRILNNSLTNEEKGIRNHFCYENKNDKLIYIIGGDTNLNKIVIDLKKESIIEMKADKKNEKNNKFLFSYSFPYYIEGNNFALFDIFFNIHIINFFSNENEFIQYY